VGKSLVKWPHTKQSKWFIRSTFSHWSHRNTQTNASASRETMQRLSWHVQFGQARKCFNTFLELLWLVQNGACFNKYMLHRIQQMRKINPSPVLFLSTHISEIKETPHVHHIIILKND